MNRPHFHPESGQAMIELTAMLVGLIAITLGLVFLAGLCWTNNRTLLAAKSEAEQAARFGANPLVGSEIGGWSYSRVKNTEWSSSQIPFGAQDQAYYYPESTVDSAAYTLQSSNWSDAYRSHSNPYLRYEYSWMTPKNFDSGKFQHDFSSGISNAWNAAELAAGRASTSTNPTGGFDDGYADDASASMRNAFFQWFGITITDRQLHTNPANTVYMPAR